MTGPVFSGQAAEVSALCACVDAYVALGDVGGAGFTMGKTWEKKQENPENGWFTMEMFHRKSLDELVDV